MEVSRTGRLHVDSSVVESAYVHHQEGTAAADVPAGHGRDAGAAACSMRWFPRSPPGPASPVPRLGFIYVSNGVIQNQWMPATTGAGFELSPILKPLEPVQGPRERAQRPVAPAGRHVRRRHRRSPARVGRLADRRARLRSDQARRRGAAGDDRRSARRAGDRQGHAGAVARAVTSIFRRRGPAIRATASTSTPSPGGTRRRRIPPSRIRASCSSGCSATAAAPPSAAARVQGHRQPSRFGHRGSDASSPGRWDRGDRTKLTRIPGFGPRDRAAHPEHGGAGSTQSVELPDRPIDIPDSFDEHTKLMLDLVALAFQADITRVFTMIFARELSTRTFPNIGVPEQHHSDVASSQRSRADREEGARSTPITSSCSPIS